MNIVGRTVDGKTVVSGVYRFFETHGLPLDVVLSTLREKHHVPCWMSLYRECASAGMGHERILDKLEAAISDSYGAAFCAHVIHGLRRLHELGRLAARTP